MTCHDIFSLSKAPEKAELQTKELDKWIYAGDTKQRSINLWGTFVCSSCGSQTFALPNKDTDAQHCQNCGKPHQKESFKPPQVMHDGSKLYFIEGTGHTGREDRVKKSLVACPYCKGSTFEDANYCGGCGAPIKGENVNKLVEDSGQRELIEAPTNLDHAGIAKQYLQATERSPNMSITNSQAIRKGLLAFSVVAGSLAVVASVHGYHWYTEPIAVRAEVVSSTTHQVTLKLNENDISGSQYMDIGSEATKASDSQWRIGEKAIVYFTRKDGARSLVRGNGDLMTPVIVMRP